MIHVVLRFFRNQVEDWSSQYSPPKLMFSTDFLEKTGDVCYNLER